MSQDDVAPSCSSHPELRTNLKIRSDRELTAHFSPLKIKALHEGTGSKDINPKPFEGRALETAILDGVSN